MFTRVVAVLRESIRPTTNAIMGLTFANYVIQPFFDDCAVPVVATQLLAALTICMYSARIS